MDRLTTVFEKYITNQCSADEIKELLGYFSVDKNGEQLKLLIEIELGKAVSKETDLETDTQDVLDQLHAYIIKEKKAKIFHLNRWLAAASILMFISAGGYFLFSKPNKDNNSYSQIKQPDLTPGGNKAILTLSNGKRIILTDAQKGLIATQGKAVIKKTADGKIVYNDLAAGSGSVIYNTMTTPKGGQYWVTLSDGTKVLLNAASTLKYPTVFTGSERLVELTGEAYFEVVHNANSPFKVKTGLQVVQDVGTRFNINAYNDEPAIITTLLEGAVNVLSTENKSTKPFELHPNEQSKFENGSFKVIPDADIELAVGWKDGHFRFKDAGVQEVMRQLARWYDVEVIYEGTIPDHLFTGDIHRNIKASQALEVLTFFKVHYKIDGRKIIITP